MKKLLSIILLAMLPLTAAYAQLTTTQTYFSTAIAATGPNTTGNTTVVLASCTGTVLPSTSAVGSYLWADAEAMQITGLVSGTIGGSGICTLNVKRAVVGSQQSAHSTSAVVYVTNQASGTGDSSRPFSGGALTTTDPAGSCTASLQYTLPIIASKTARVWTCPSSGPLSGQWAVLYDPFSAFSFSDAAAFIGPGACQSSVSGNSTGTNGFTNAGGIPVVQAQTSNTGTNTHTYTCHLTLPTRLRGASSGPGAGVAIANVVAVYGVQSNSLGTQAATLASGTMNSTVVFQKITAPTPAASETQSAAAARADSGTLTITPVVASFNVGTTTAGQFFSAQFTPATPLLTNSDLTDYIFSMTLQCAATTATVTNLAGLYVHLINVPL